MSIVASLKDVTERRRVEKIVESQRQQLIHADKMASLGTMAAGVAHEINNPNSFIMLNAPALTKMWKDIAPIIEEYNRENSGLSLGGLPYSEAKDHIPKLLTGITEGSRRIKGIVDELKDFVRQDVSRRETLIDINAVVNKTVSLLQSQIKKFTQNFSVDLYQNLPAIKGNFLEIEQVIINLITNACQALGDKKKKLFIGTSFDHDKRNVIVEVVDEGKGISPENLPKITEPFFTTKREQGGTGLGLSISYNIIKEHGGMLSFASALGKGTTATIALPVAEKTEGG